MMIFQLEKKIDWELWVILMEINTKEIGWKMKSLEKDRVLKHMKMEINIMVVFLMEKKLYLELWLILMVISIKENGFKMKLKEKEFLPIKRVFKKNFKVNFWMAINMW